MHVLVYWLSQSTVSIVTEEDLFPNVSENESTLAKYKNGKKYKAKVMKKSHDEAYLKKLSVSSEGVLLPVKKSSTSEKALLQKSTLKLQKNDKKQKKENISSKCNLKLASLKSIFENDDSMESESEEAGISGIEQREREMEQEQQREQERKRERERDRERQREQELRDEENQERERYRKRQREQELRGEENQERERYRKRQREQELRGEENQERERYRKRQREQELRCEENQEQERERERERDREEMTEREEVDDENRNNKDPLVECRRAGNGRVALCDTYNIWIDKGELTHLQRWLENPKQLTRSLLKILVGEDHLKGMCARGNSKRNRPIPKDILTAVEYYVNRKCTKRLTPAEFTNVINMMCATLRNPKPK